MEATLALSWSLGTNATASLLPEPHFSLHTLTAGISFPKNIFLITSADRNIRGKYKYQELQWATFEFLSDRAVDEEVDRGIEDEEKVIETHDTEVPGGLQQLGLASQNEGNNMDKQSYHWSTGGCRQSAATRVQ